SEPQSPPVCPLGASRTRTMRKARNLTASYNSFPPRDVRTNPGKYPQFPHQVKFAAHDGNSRVTRWKPHRKIVLMSAPEGTTTGGRRPRRRPSLFGLMSAAT